MHDIHITGCDRAQELLLLNKISDDVNLSGRSIEVDFSQKIKVDRGDSLWYGGEMAYIQYNGYGFSISADGDVRASLISKKDNSEVVSVYDKSSSALFAEEMGQYIKNDAHLHAIMGNKDNEYVIDLGNSNWYELMYIDKENHCHDLGCALSSSIIYDAIAEALGIIPVYIKDINEGVI